MKQHFVYIMASVTRTTYIGVTRDLHRRVWEHRTAAHHAHTSRYRQSRLVHVESFQWVTDAIAREKQLKRWARSKKVALIEQENPAWHDLAAEWFVDAESVNDSGRQ